ncbi:hypothetical protein [Streptomyces violarus]|uniref:hypothetical protein n=1 Tax=Streptomyces violarus TaxID=67380 RepID=UPI0021C08B6B|nr:hypothetical protein [Streptomyces violarus]MCT9142284.1 hypothetical protein [Streptomyces violarus]
MHRHGRSPESEADARAGHPHRPLLRPHEDSAQAARLAAGGQLTPDAAVSLQRTAGNAAFVAVQRMPQGGNGEGPAEEKPMDGLSRLRRAHERERKRGQTAPAYGPGQSPFGPYTVNKGRGAAPYITSNVKHQHPGSESLGTTYDELIKALDAEHHPLVAAALKGQDPTEEELAGMSATQRRAAAMLYGITKDSEPLRFAGAGKAARSALNKQGDPYHEAEEYEKDFPMAQVGGAQSYRKALAGETQLSAEALQNLKDMSESSSDGEKSS